MTAPFRVLLIVLALATSALVAPAARAQQAATPAGPTMASAAVGFHAVSNPTTAMDTEPGHPHLGTALALVIIGGGGFIAGLIIGGGAGIALAIAGALVALYGLYLFLR